jgi:hypothetical protein
MYMRHEGTSGNTQGETKDNSPVKKAAMREVCGRDSSMVTASGSRG